MITVLAIGKKHESWVEAGIERYQKRLRQPYDIRWLLLPHSSLDGETARHEESKRMLAKITPDDFVVLLDERGTNYSSPALAEQLRMPLDRSQHVVCIIGGAYGVDDSVSTRADVIWSLSKLVFPHQLVRLLLAEQLYRAQEIAAGRPYHHQ